LFPAGKETIWQQFTAVLQTPSAPNRAAGFSWSRCTWRGSNAQAVNVVTLLKNMSQHRSLRAASTSGAKRNVLKRFERVALLKKRTQWKTGDRVTGLRKTKPEA
jgi:small basic protein (TIGR04137 family)